MIVTTWIVYCWATGKIHGAVRYVSIARTDEVRTVGIEENIPSGDQAQRVNGQNTSVAVVSVQETEVGTEQSDAEDEEELNLQALMSEINGQLLWRRAILVTSVQNDQHDLGVSLETSEGVKDCQMIEWTSSSPEPMIESLTPAVNLDDIDCQIEQENSVNGNSNDEDRSAGEVSSVAIDDYPEDQASLLSNTEAATVDNTPAGAFTNFPDDDEMDSSDLESSSDTWSFKSTGFLFVQFSSSSENDSLLSNTERAITDNTTATGMDVNIDLELPLDSDTCNSTGQLHRQFPSNTESEQCSAATPSNLRPLLEHSVERMQSWLADKSAQVKKELQKSQVASNTRNIVERSTVRVRSWKAEIEEKIRRRLGRGPKN
ncbi:uncharacterized protein LOC119963223 [Scyliorhinus canicula]|uniref:uncharacterized protein LOC119963223 n=1 Tax=Scyliorhinus canicula TaxID=7830 RepID=UPI0018F3F940|nr:uncharacterized protein LOC119963223 [Scyliorhinus canicula]